MFPVSEDEIKSLLAPYAQRLCEGRKWNLGKFLGAGATAATFEVVTPDGLQALKIYLPSFLEGQRGIQIKKRLAIVLENLKGHTCPYLVSIFDGGATDDTVFLLMQRAPGECLGKVLHFVPPRNIREIIRQVSTAAHFLEDRGLCHRDIKSDIQASPNNSSSGVFEEIRDIAPQLSGLQSIDEISAEQRVKSLRDLSILANKASSDGLQSIYFAAGYIISRIGGAERDLRLAETFEHGYPIVLTWAAVLGGLGATTYWSDAFGGIGRLVARELSRSFDICEPPSSDISADELFVLAGPDRRGAKFRTASRQSASVSLRLGVVTQLSFVEEERKSEPSRPVSAPQSTADVVENRRNLNLAEQLFPFIKRLLIEDGFEPQRDKRNLRKSRSPQLPLK